MTIRIKPKKGFLSGFTIEGHADYGEYGKDIVCASVSVLARTTLLGLNRYTRISSKMENGYIDVTVYEKSPEIEGIMTAVGLTLQSISDEYPEFVIIEGEDLNE